MRFLYGIAWIGIYLVAESRISVCIAAVVLLMLSQYLPTVFAKEHNNYPVLYHMFVIGALGLVMCLCGFMFGLTGAVTSMVIASCVGAFIDCKEV